MQNVNDLTTLVFLKDRASFTERLCRYLSLIRYPYRVFFADGSLGEENAHFFMQGNENKLQFNFTYRRYAKDSSLDLFYQKCYLSALEIKTPYVMLADNDDFPIIEGQRACLDFLKKNLNYVGCNGRVPGMVLSPSPQKPYGNHLYYLKYYCHEMDRQTLVNQASACMRIRSYLSNFYSIFYSVFRTASVVDTFGEINRLNFSDLGIFELFFSYMQLSQGKIYSLPAVAYVRQKGSSQTAINQKDWFHRLFYTNWLSDCQRAIDSIAQLIERIEKLDKEEVYQTLYTDLVDRLRNRYLPNDFYLLKNFGKLLNKDTLSMIILNKIFKKKPAWGEFLSSTINPHFGDDTGLKAIQTIVRY